MEMEIQFTVVGAPVPKARPRRGLGGHFYTPRETRDWERLVGLCALAARPAGWSLEGSIEVEIEFRCETCRADVDNLVKSVLDGCNGVLWRDDRQVCRVTAERRKVAGHGGCTMRVRRRE